MVILGLTFKEDCPDTRNSKVIDIVKRLEEYGVRPVIVDPQADAAEAKREYGVELTAFAEVHDADCVILAVAHKEFKAMTPAELDRLFTPGTNDQKVVIDVKSILDKQALENAGYRFWRL